MRATMSGKVLRITALFACLLTTPLLMAPGCPAASNELDDVANDNASTNDNDGDNENAGANDNGADSDDDSGGVDNDNIDNGGTDNGGDGQGDSAGAGFGAIHGRERLEEEESFDYDDGGFRRRKEIFTASWSLTPTRAETAPVFVNDELVDSIIGDVVGTAHLTYSESGTDFASGLDCPTQTYAGEVAWDTQVEGTYSFIPVLGQLSINVHAVTVSSPEYEVAFINPECPALDSISSSSYYWGGPGVGSWGGVLIVLQNGVFESRIENPQGEDRGDSDFYEIEAESTSE